MPIFDPSGTYNPNEDFYEDEGDGWDDDGWGYDGWGYDGGFGSGVFNGGFGGAIGGSVGGGGGGTTPTANAPTSGGGVGNFLWDIGQLAVTAYGTKNAVDAAKDAGQLQYQSTVDANRAIEAKFRIGKEGLDPYSEAGVPAINRESAILGLQGDEAQTNAMNAAFAGPGFEYTRNRIIGDINRGASATGQIKSGNRLAALTDRLAGVYGNRQDNYINQVGNLGRVGLSGASAIAGVSQNAGAGISNNTVTGGTAQGNATLGKTDAYNSGLNELYDSARKRWGG